MKKLIFLLSVLSFFGGKAQDTIRFSDGRSAAVKVSEVGIEEIKYNRFDNLTGPTYVVNKNEVKYIRYANGSVDTFTPVAPKKELPKTDNPGAEPSKFDTPAYVDQTSPSQFERINIRGKKLYYQHQPLKEKQLLMLIRDHPDQQTRNLMLREYSKIPIYKNNRMVGTFIYIGGIATSVFALGGAFGRSAGSAFLVGAAAGISGSIIATVNKNKRARKRVDIARIYNGDLAPSK